MTGYLSAIWRKSVEPTTPVEKKEEPENDVLSKEVDAQLSSWYGTGASKGLDKIAAVIKTIFTNRDHRRDFFEDVAHGVKSGFMPAQNSEESEEGLVKSIFNGLREMSSAAFGEISGIALRNLLENAQEYNLDEEDKTLIEDSKKELEEANRPSKGTFYKATDFQKIACLQEIFKKVLPLAEMRLDERDRYEITSIQKELEKSLAEGDTKTHKIKDPSHLYRAAKLLQKFLGRVQPNEEIGKMQSTLNELLKSVRTLYIVAENIRKKLSKYHVIVGGFDVSVLLKWKEEKAVNPISTLVDCQSQVEALKKSFDLQAPSQEIPLPNEQQSIPSENNKRLDHEGADSFKTDEQLSHFCETLAAMCSMKAVDYCLGKKRDEQFYQRMLSQGEGEVRQSYAKTFSGIGKYLVQLPFIIIYKLVSPLISKTFFKLVEDMRAFLRNNLDLLKFSEQKIEDLYTYFVEIDNTIPRFREEMKSTQVGSFDDFCQQKIETYAKKFTEKELLNIFKKFIVDRYVARPNCAIKNFRIPLLTSFAEWMIYSIRKSIIKNYLKNSQIVETYLKEGTQSVQLAQLGFKQVLVKKLTQFKQSMEQNMARRIKPVVRGESAPLDQENERIEALRAQLISPDFHKTIEKFSRNLVQFINIESCQEDKNQLFRLVDNRVNTLFQDLQEVLQPILPLDSFSPNETMKSACTKITESVIITFFSAKDSQIEEHLQSTLELLGRSFTYYNEVKDREAALRRYQQELNTVDQNLNTLLREISQIAVKEAVHNKLDNISGERHIRVEQFVTRENRYITEWGDSLITAKEKMQHQLQSNETGEKQFQNVKLLLALFVEEISQQTNHLSNILYSNHVAECYSDVKQELFQVYQEVLDTISNKMLSELQEIATQNKCVYEIDQSTQLCNDFETVAQSIAEADPKNNAKAILQLTDWLKQFPQELTQHVKGLEELPSQIKQNSEHLRYLTDYYQKSDQKGQFETTNQQIDKIEEELNAIAVLTKEHSSIQINRKYLTADSVTQAKEELKKQIIEKIKTFKSTYAETSISESLYKILQVLPDSDLSALSKQLISESFFSSRTLLTDLRALKKENHVKIYALNKALIQLEPKLPKERTVETLEGLQSAKKQELQEHKSEIQKKLTEIRKINLENRERAFEKMQTALQKIHAFTSDLKEAAKKPHVKGYITVGQLQTRQTLSPKIVEGIAPYVQTKMETIVGALGKPFHWKQLVLRLILADIAKRQDLST